MDEFTRGARTTLSLTPVVTNCLICSGMFRMPKGACFTLLSRNNGGLELHITGLVFAITTQTHLSCAVKGSNCEILETR